MLDYIFNDWVFHYCPYSVKWKAATRDNMKDLFNNSNSDKVIKSNKIETLIELIQKTKGDISKMNKLTK